LTGAAAWHTIVVNGRNRRNHSFEISGIVTEGGKKATALGYPTANIACESAVPSGIYAGSVVWKGAPTPRRSIKKKGRT